MDFHLRRAQTLASLPQIKNRLRGTGAISLNPDSRLRAMSSFAKVAPTVPAASADLSAFVKDAYDQGTEDSCVAYSIAGIQSIFQQILANNWLTFDAEELYRDNGGTGANGISATDALSWDEGTGLLDLASKSRYPIKDFAFADPMSAEGLAAIKSAITAQCPCVLALLLPSDFSDQFNASGDCNGTITSDYHQVCLIGYDATRFTFLNSWGKTWGKNGIGTIACSFLQDPAQAGSAYAYTVSDTAQPNAKPFLLKAWTDGSYRDDMTLPLVNLSWFEKIKAWKVPTGLWIGAGIATLTLVIWFVAEFHKQLFSVDTFRIWVVGILGFMILAAANSSIFSPGPGSSDPTSVRYVIAFNSVIFIVLGLATLVIFLHNWGASFFIAGGSLLAGGFFGLLFGYPTGVAQQNSGQANSTKSTPAIQTQNKNLLAESASTFGKLITGFTLAKLKTGSVYLDKFCGQIAFAFDAQSSHDGKIIAAGVLAYFFATGFLSGLLLPSYFMSGKFGEP